MNTLLLVHRVPYPPNRGDRIRSWQLLKWLAARSDVDLACLADEPVASETRDALHGVCRRVAIEPVGGVGRWTRAAWSLATGGAATEGLFASSRLRRTISAWSSQRDYDAVVVFCSSMAQYIELPRLRRVPAIVDLVDVDSQKWRDYATAARGGKRTLFALEGRRLQVLESRIAGRATAVTVVSDAEADVLRAFCPHAPVHPVGNGVDLDYFAPPADAHTVAMHVEERAAEVVFVGALDYRANVDGLAWFCEQVWPEVLRRADHARLTLVGRRPVAAVRALAELPGVTVAADVPDVRPYLERAAVVIAPLRIARGVQNKVLEAAAMGKAIVASPAALAGLELVAGEHACRADEPSEWSAVIATLLASPERRRDLGERARRLVESRYRWHARLAPLEPLFARATGRAAAADELPPLSASPPRMAVDCRTVA